MQALSGFWLWLRENFASLFCRAEQSRDIEDCRFTGTDIDPQAILWDETQYPKVANWVINNMAPPLLYDDAVFDAIVAVSVFTHLDEDLQLAWLKEIDRVMAPDGIAILTIHGESIWKDYPTESEVVREKGFCFLVSNSGVRNYFGLPEFYQTAFHSREYIDRVWGKIFDVVDYVEKGVNGYQDAVILKKRIK